MIQEQNLGATFTDQSCVTTQNRGERAVLAETAKDSVTGVVAIPAVIFFPDKTYCTCLHDTITL